MDNFYLLGSIASIISLGFMFWSIIKKTQISFFNLYMLIIVLIQAILIGWGLWNGKNMIAVIFAGMCLMFSILFWLVMYLSGRQLDLIKSQTEIIKSQGKIIKEINQDMRQLANLFGEFIESTRELMVDSIRINTNTERLEEELKKLQKKIRKKKLTK